MKMETNTPDLHTARKEENGLGNRTILIEKLKESLSSVLPVTLIIFVLCFTIAPVPNGIMMAFVLGAVMLIAGMSLFTLGADMAMTPIGQHVGAGITKSRKLWVVILVSLVMGVLVTISEPDLHVLAEQVSGVPNMVLIMAVAIGVGIFLVVAMLRILFKIRLSWLLLGLYILTFGVAYFVPDSFLAVAFDSGGVTTGPMTVPFIMALGVGVAQSRSDKNAENDSFGLIALCSVGPILAVLILGMIYRPDSSDYVHAVINNAADSAELWGYFSHAFPEYFKEVAVALAPIVVFFFIFQIFTIKLHKTQLIKIVVGVLYTYLGLVIFLTGVNVGFMPIGRLLGQELASLSYNWIIIPIGMVIGYFIVAAEPAVHVLNKQVFEISSGAIPEKAMSLSLSIGVSLSVGLSLMRIIYDIPLMYLLIPGYAIALALTFVSPPIFTAIAFDSGGVASGPMTATFLLPLAIGTCMAMGENILTDAFGVVAMVAMTPLIAIQILGCVSKFKARRAPEVTVQTEEIIEL